ncbi:BLUF domain-containing protein [Sphingomonas mesophila]|uniref:BLUF domain-containing protein n=1 Tax=Sphingomonas mesophila TaxID=2303576 RepID=UPI000E57B828|nr:BLUF domain-containing protein [Sphingomonas mesophila]
MSHLKKLVYVSQSRLAAAEAERAVADIVALATPRNDRLEIGGALMFTGHRFAQWLEGPAANVDLLMRSIAADVRHRDIQIVVDCAVELRSFSGWGLAFGGRSLVVDRHLKAALNSGWAFADGDAARRLERLMIELAHAQWPGRTGVGAALAAAPVTG